MSLRQTRNTIPKLVSWDQAAILNAISSMVSNLTRFVHSIGPPAVDARGAVVREVTAERLLETLEGINEQIKITNLHLSILTEENFNLGDQIDGT